MANNKKNLTNEAIKLKKINNHIDTEFQNLIDFLKNRSYDEIYNCIIKNLNCYKNRNSEEYNNVIRFYNKLDLWGKFIPEKNEYSYVKNLAKAFFEHLKDFVWLYENLSDYRSKYILNNILYYWFMDEKYRVEKLNDKTFKQYFDFDIISCDKSEIFVDVGGYIGDTLKSYVYNFGKENYKKIYCYEIVEKNIEAIKAYISEKELKNISIRIKGASDKNSKMFINEIEQTSTTKLLDKGNIQIPTVKIDDDIKGKVTFIKMDIEGGEYKALLGCKEKIKEYHPKLAISVYHNHEDLWKISKLILKFDSSYKFYLRYYGGSIIPTEFVLFAI